MSKKITDFLTTLLTIILILGMSAIVGVACAAIVNRLILWGFPAYGC